MHDGSEENLNDPNRCEKCWSVFLGKTADGKGWCYCCEQNKKNEKQDDSSA